jgi:GTP-binding protein
LASNQFIELVVRHIALVAPAFSLHLPGMPLTVAIVGRPNVGKSAIFNRLAGRRIAIVHDQPGVTRDRISAPSQATATPCTLLDTGGIGAPLDDGFASQVALEADIAIQSADLILFVVDAREGLTPVDETLSKHLRGTGPETILVVNKTDTPGLEHAASDFAKLGMETVIPVSAEHGRNFRRLAEEIDRRLAPKAQELDEVVGEAESAGLRLAIVGKPNAGKSSLVNAILDDSRAIVSDIAGTTRDAIDLPYERDGQRFTLIDTAGLRQRTRRSSSVEVFSAMRSEKAIRRSDLCLLVIDLAAGVSSQDRKIARMLQKEKKPCVIVLNKFDLFHPDAPRRIRIEEATEHVRRELFFLDYAPFVAVSSTRRQAVGLVLAKVLEVRKQAAQVPSTGQLNRVLKRAVESNPPPARKGQNKRLKLFYATTAVDPKYSNVPVPTYILFVNDKRLVSESYRQYLSNRLREAFPSPGLPLVFSFRSRPRAERSGRK